MVELVTKNYWWLRVTREVGRYVEGCNLYQRMKNQIEKITGKIKLSEVLEKLWTHMIVDFIMKLLIAARKDVILVVCDRLSEMIHFVATIEEISAEGLARLFRDNIQRLHRLPESVVSDRRPQFVVELTKELNKMLGIETRLSIVFHFQIDEQTEQMNQELEQYLRFFIDHQQKDWLEQLALAEFTVNNKIHIATKVSPFMTNYGRELRMEGNIRKKRKVESVIEFVERMKKVHEKAGVALKKVQENMKRQVDKGRKKQKTGIREIE